MATLHIPLSFSIGGDIVDSNVDLLKIEIPNPTDAVITKVSINSLYEATGTATIEVRNTSNGGGDAITVTFVSGETYAEATGNLTLTEDYVWIRSGTANGLGMLNGILRYYYNS